MSTDKKYIPRYGEWIPLTEALVADYVGNIVCRFETGEIRLYDDEDSKWPREQVTHILKLPELGE